MSSLIHFSKPVPRSVRFPGRQKGAIALITGFVLVVLLGVGAFAIDLAHAYVVRNELQNGADASAIAGATCLYERADCANAGLSEPTWDSAEAKANTYLQFNKAEGRTVSTATIDAGYWNLTLSQFTVMPAAGTWTPTAADVPAVRVNIEMSGNTNGGGVSAFLSRVFGNTEIPMSAQAIAVVAPPSGVTPGALTPFVLSKCLYDQYWNSQKNEPLLAKAGEVITVGSTQGNQSVSIAQVSDTPYVFPAVSEYAFQGTNCDSGQWTTFSTGSNSANDVRGFVTSGNPTPLAIGGDTFIATGNMASAYQEVHNCSAAGTKSCEYSTVPVVNNSSLVNTNQKVVAFACVRILSADWSGKVKHIRMQMSSDPSKCNVSGTPGGPNYGVIVPPRLAL